MESQSEVARQIRVLLVGLAQRARGAGLTELAGDLDALARKAERSATDPANDRSGQ